MPLRRWNWPYLIVCAAILLSVAWYVGSALIPGYWPSQEPIDSSRRLLGISHARDRAMDVLATSFLFWLGACIGSYLNVVIYRVPRGLTLLGHSMCPSCRQPIHAIDNLPVFAWLRLRGRCRVCHVPIASRYMWVELAVGLIFLGLGIWELGTGGGNLPGVAQPRYFDFAWGVFLPDWRVALLYVTHVAILSTVFCETLISWDGHSVSVRLWWFASLLALLAVGLTPYVPPIAWDGSLYGMGEWHAHRAASPSAGVEGFFASRWISAAVGGLVGIVSVTTMRLPASRETAGRATMGRLSFASGLISGVALGWQGVLTVWSIASLLAGWLLSGAGLSVGVHAVSRSGEIGDRRRLAVWSASWGVVLFGYWLFWSRWHDMLWGGARGWLVSSLLVLMGLVALRRGRHGMGRW